MTTEQGNDQIKQTADRLAESAYRALSNVARSLADGQITPAELPAIIVWLDSVESLTAEAKELAKNLSNRSTWLNGEEKAS